MSSKPESSEAFEASASESPFRGGFRAALEGNDPLVERYLAGMRGCRRQSDAERDKALEAYPRTTPCRSHPDHLLPLDPERARKGHAGHLEASLRSMPSLRGGSASAHRRRSVELVALHAGQLEATNRPRQGGAATRERVRRADAKEDACRLMRRWGIQVHRAAGLATTPQNRTG